MALRAGVYLVLGGIGGVALAENKELVGDYLYDAGMFVKSFAKQLETVEYSGQALASYPGVKQLFDALGGISLTRGEVQTHVDTASAAVKDIVKKSPTNARGDPASLSSSVMLMCLKAAAVGCTAYVCYDARARKAALDALDRMRGWGQVHVKSCLNKSKAMLGDANLSEAVTNVHASLDKKRQHFKRHLDGVRVKIAESGVQEKATLIAQSALALVLEQAEKTKQLVAALADKKPATGGI